MAVDISKEIEKIKYAVYGRDTRESIANALNKMNNEIGIPDTVKVALINAFEHLVYIDEEGKNYYNALYAALYHNSSDGGQDDPDNKSRITAEFNPGGNTIYTDDELDSIKQYLIVTYYEDDESSGETIASDNYVLTGQFVSGSSLIYVSYNNCVTSVEVETVDFYNIYNWSNNTNLTKLTNYNAEQGYDGHTIYVDQNSGRYTFCCTRGKRAAVTKSYVETSYYPIPVPENATRMVVSASASTTKLYAYMFTLDSTGYTLTHEVTGWKIGSQTETFNAGSSKYVIVACQSNSDLTITFS